MAKRFNEENSIEDVLKAFIEVNKLSAGIEKVDVREAWFKLMGTGITNYTDEVLLKNRTLYVRITSSVLREELSYGKDKIVAMLNEELKKDVVTTLVLR